MMNDENQQMEHHRCLMNHTDHSDSSQAVLDTKQSSVSYDWNRDAEHSFAAIVSNANDKKSIEVPYGENVSQYSVGVDIDNLSSNNVLENNNKPIISSRDLDSQSETFNLYSPRARLLAEPSEGIFERILLLNQLLMVEKVDAVPDCYDEMKAIELAIRRNAIIQAGPDGQTLLDLATAAVSNRNWDLNRFGAEIQRQFGLHSVEVVGDGACAFRAMIISGMGQMDSFYHAEVREHTIEQVMKYKAYYGTVLHPGSRASDGELLAWAKSMRDVNTYADELANIAMADFYHVQLVIFRAGELLTVINPRDGYVKYIAFLINVGTHYKALVTRAELHEAQKNSERLNGIEH